MANASEYWAVRVCYLIGSQYFKSKRCSHRVLLHTEYLVFQQLQNIMFAHRYNRRYRMAFVSILGLAIHVLPFLSCWVPGFIWHCIEAHAISSYCNGLVQLL